MTGPARSGPGRREPAPWPVAAGVATLLVALLAAVVAPDLPHRSADSSWYLKMARGEAADVPAPFAGRIVHTGLARLLVDAGMDADRAFLAVGVVACWLAVAGVAWLHRRHGLPAGATLLVVGGWQAATLLRDATLPDALAAAALVACAVAAARRPAAVWPLLVLAVACRASLALAALVGAVLAWRAGRRGSALAACAAGAAGLLAVRLASGAANVHGLDGPVYLAAKAGFNLSRNVAGWELWVPTIDYCDPVRVWAVPDALAAGGVDRVGVCGFNAVRPLTLLAAWTGVFGVLPGWLWARRRHVAAAWPGAPLWLRTALVYGLASALLAPAAGTLLGRLVGYGWPAFWLAAPLLGGLAALPPRLRRPLAALHVAAAWGVPLVAAAWPLHAPALAGAAVAGLALNVGAARLAGDAASTGRPASSG